MKLAKVVYLFIILSSIVATPYVVEYATKIRGYKAYGGEYLTPCFGWIIATIFYEICKEINYKKKIKTRSKNYE